MRDLEAADLDERLRAFLSEDIGRVDVTTAATVPSGTRTRGELVARSSACVSGTAGRTPRVRAARSGPRLGRGRGGRRESRPRDAARVPLGRGRAILTAERVALNLLQRLSGIATATRRYVDAVAGTGCRILDTRKTTPGLRLFEK